MLTGALQTIYTEEAQLDITVSDPCLLTGGYILSNPITAIDYWIGDGAQATVLGFWDD